MVEPDEIETEMFANRNSDTGATFGDEMVGVGQYKKVLKARYNNCRPAVAKFLKKGTTFSDECFLYDVRSAEEALPIIAEFQKYVDSVLGRGRVSLKINIPEVWQQTSDVSGLKGQKVLVEPYIKDFKKFNSNTGANDAQAAIAQTFSHFSYHATDGQWLLCDLQGGLVGNTYTLTDILINSRDKRFGVTDLGVAGIETFLSQHHCNQFCCSKWRGWKGAQARIPVKMGSTTDEYNHMVTQPTGQIILQPSTIRFTQDSISNYFAGGKSLMETVAEVAGKELHKRDILMMRVVYVNGYYHSLDNRCLAIFRILEYCGILSTIRCAKEPWHAVAEEYGRKKGYGDGETITIRRTPWKVGVSANSTTFPYDRVNEYAHNANALPDDGTALRFLASIIDD
eukprot:CAMPEP_0183738648 /NCGR_PEP_ID=MMETSP0737-20130205/55126_1 /TAXON_ID=385413 /ORGANISM="Thalassiosira miniscula, Strain CCMP1093" /LENGTH=396 /DNA_ID=CAMNT_0025973233 /DNA_START=12 /DNA_END=1202 /DNA_ORIENTATION=-